MPTFKCLVEKYSKSILVETPDELYLFSTQFKICKIDVTDSLPSYLYDKLQKITV